MKKFYPVFSGLLIFSAALAAQTNLPSTLCDQTLTMSGSPYRADTTVIVPNGCILTVDPGVEIKMAYNTYFIVRGKADFMGTAALPITLRAKDPDTAWGIIYFDSTRSQKSTLNYVTIEDATMGTFGTQHSDSAFQQAALSGFNSAIELNHCTFKDNLMCIYSMYCNNMLIKNCTFDSTNVGEKIHLERSDSAVIDSCILFFTAGEGDAMDIDGSDDVIISNNQVFGGDADAIDIGISDSTGCQDIRIRGNFIYQMGDKGISCGEVSSLTAEHNIIVGCSKGIGVKSDGAAMFRHNTLYSNTVGLVSYDKGDGWGVGNLTVSNCIIAASDTTLYVDSVSFLSVGYSLSDMELMPGTGNIMGNPMFVSPSDDSLADFSLMWGSPAIDSGDPAFAPDPDGTPTDMGAFYYPHALAIPIIHEIACDIRIYPNPAKHYFTITVPSKLFPAGTPEEDPLPLSVSDLLGHIVKETRISAYKSKVDISGLHPGIYFIGIQPGETKIFKRKLVIRE